MRVKYPRVLLQGFDVRFSTALAFVSLVFHNYAVVSIIM